ncbi:aminopeptidase [Eubacteriales bacterium OttesenSCG-928-N14]|nr:aminopeptidase [Eubacteriales bacterium OttesenSCG-928-N14]
MDDRVKALTDLLTNYSLTVQPGDNVLINARGYDADFVCSMIESIYAAGGRPFFDLTDLRITRAVYLGMDDAGFGEYAKYLLPRLEDMQGYVSFSGHGNEFELSDVPGETMQSFRRNIWQPMDETMNRNHTRWVVVNYPTAIQAQKAGMSTQAFTDFFFDVCTVDYAAMSAAMDPLVDLMNRTEQVRIVAKDTDLSFSIAGMPAIKCDGKFNVPDGEVFTAPVKDSIQGVITFNTPSVQDGIRFENIKLVFEQGKVVQATSSNTAATNRILDTDDGARYVGEFALGVNNAITRAMCDTLFDEKIGGSLHFACGASYDDCPNGNKSAVHWDIVQIQTPQYGGGEIYFDGVLIRKDGVFTLPELYPLNG